MRWYRATRMLHRKSNSNYTQSCTFLYRLLGGVYLWGFMFPPSWSPPHLLCITKACLKKMYCLYVFPDGFYSAVAMFQSTNSDECFEQTQHSLRTLQSVLIRISPTFILVLISLFSYLMLKLPAQSTACSFFSRWLVFYFALVHCQKRH